MATDPDGRLERNLRLYPWLHVGRSALFWLPVFVLYFSATLSPGGVLQLEALYYAGVVLLEVPSGYLSDRLGRRPVLVLASVAWAMGSAVLAWGGSFGVLACGQLLLAGGMAFQSGTDSSLLFDTLTGLGRAQEFARREARAQALGFATLAASALIGGALAGVDLRLGHGLSAGVGLVAVVAALGMTEPNAAERAPGPVAQLRSAARHARDPVLRWTLAFGIGLTVWIHIPYELLQPWLAALVQHLDRPDYAATPLVSGVVTCAVMGLAAVLGPWGPTLAERVGPRATLLGSWALLMGVMAAMAATIHPALVPVLALRGVPSALADPVLAAAVHPRLPSGLRATWLSGQSLLGRLAFSAALGLGAAAVGAEQGWTEPALRAVLIPATVAGVGWGLMLGVFAPKL